MENRLDAVTRRRLLLAVAREHFATWGYHQSSMDAIGRQAGVSKPVLYTHFGSKEGLHAAVLTELADELRTVTTEAVAAATTAREKLRAGLEAYFGFAAENPALHRLLLGREGGPVEDGGPADAVAAALVDDLAAVAADNLAVEGFAPERRLTLGHAIVGMAQGALRRWESTGRAVPVETLAEELTTLAWFGLRGLAA